MAYRHEELDAGATVMKMLQMLPPPLQTAFRLRVIEDMSYEAIVAKKIGRAREHNGHPDLQGAVLATQAFLPAHELQT